MPQLDKVTYFSQFFWLCVFYLGFYLALVKYFLPRISRILKVRRIKSVSKDQSFNDEGAELGQKINGLYLDGFKTAREFLVKNFNNTEKLLKDMIAQTNGKQLNQVDKKFIQSLELGTLKNSQILSDFNATSPLQSVNKSNVVIAEIFQDTVEEALFEGDSQF